VIRSALKPGDIVLVEANTRLSAIIKFLTQSTWSHAALYVGDRPADIGFDAFAGVPAFAALCEERDNRLRNASHHGDYRKAGGCLCLLIPVSWH
jgi:hypothetical protein